LKPPSSLPGGAALAASLGALGATLAATRAATRAALGATLAASLGALGATLAASLGALGATLAAALGALGATLAAALGALGAALAAALGALGAALAGAGAAGGGGTELTAPEDGIFVDLYLFMAVFVKEKHICVSELPHVLVCVCVRITDACDCRRTKKTSALAPLLCNHIKAAVRSTSIATEPQRTASKTSAHLFDELTSSDQLLLGLARDGEKDSEDSKAKEVESVKHHGYLLVEVICESLVTCG
jgi:hypothetical protein